MLFLGKEYEINSTGVTALDGASSDPNIRSTLIYYITSKGSGEPSYSYSLPHHFIPGPIGGEGVGVSWMTNPITRKFGNDSDRLCETLKMLGAIYEGSPQKGSHVWLYRILPKIPMQISYFEADDEFPCEVKLLLDNNAGRFMEFEQLAFLCRCFVKSLRKLAAVSNSVNTGKPRI